MSEHVSRTMLSALADGELSADEMVPLKEHLDECPVCTSQALSDALLKTGTAKAGQRYRMASEFHEEMQTLVALEPEKVRSRGSGTRRNWAGIMAWTAAGALLVAVGIPVYLNGGLGRFESRPHEQAAVVGEISDLHVAALATSQPEVRSSDRHTVKPWFQGKIPFSFNLPDGLPDGVQLDGANLVYLRSEPVAQLLYRVGQHRASVFIRQRGADSSWNALPQERAGFQIDGFHTAELDVVAISDVERARLMALMAAIERVQTNAASQSQGNR